MPAEIIFHHYDTSPFSEKVRLMFGAKGLAWRSAIQPIIMPKPDLTPLTGGYRRIPVMQIGADVYCDTQVIMAEIERRHPGAGDTAGPGFAVNYWADRLFFQAAVPIIFGEMGDRVPRAFIEDREKLSGRPFDVAAMQAAALPMKVQFRAQAAWIEQALGDSDFLSGKTAGLADFAAYMNIWFVGGAVPQITDALLAGLDRVIAWRKRVAAIGHGQRQEITTTEALDVARAAEPAAYADHDAHDPLGLAPGAAIKVMADDYGRDPIAGTLVAANAGRIVIAREDPDLGKLHVHFPRAGYFAIPG
jgi:glutathione S-transferase